MFRHFARKFPTRPKDWTTVSTPLTKEFEKYIAEQKESGKTEDQIQSELISQSALHQITHAMETGKDIDISKLDIHFSKDLEARLEEKFTGAPDFKIIPSEIREMPSDITNRLNKLKNK